MSNNYNKARRRLVSYLTSVGVDCRQDGGGVLSAKKLSDLAEQVVGITRSVKPTKYVILVSHDITLPGRDLVRHTPKWADKRKIKAIYKRCREISNETSTMHHVDHIVPIKGKFVSGLHVHENLQIISKTDNLNKSNKYKYL